MYLSRGYAIGIHNPFLKQQSPAEMTSSLSSAHDPYIYDLTHMYPYKVVPFMYNPLSWCTGLKTAESCGVHHDSYI